MILNIYGKMDMNCTNQSIAFSAADGIVAGSFASVISFFGVLMNFFTIVALLKYKKTRSHATTPFIISLATSDLIFSGVTLPILAVKFFSREWILGRVACRLFPIIFYGNTAVTLLSLMSVTINRWALINCPDKAEKIFSRFKSKLIIACAWLFPVVLMMPSALGIFGHHGLKCISRSCTILEKNDQSPKNMFLAMGLIIPCFVLFITNILIFRKVKTMRILMEEQIKNSSTRMPVGLRDREQKLTKMMGFIFCCFLITYMPGAITKLIDSEHKNPSVHVFTYVLNWMAVVINPSIYVITQARYREALEYLFLGFVSKKNIGSRIHMTARSSHAMRSSVSEQ